MIAAARAKCSLQKHSRAGLTGECALVAVQQMNSVQHMLWRLSAYRQSCLQCTVSRKCPRAQELALGHL